MTQFRAIDRQVVDVQPTRELSALYAAHYLPLVRLALHLVDDLESAEDVVQDVFAGAGRALDAADPLRYLQAAVVNRSRSALRRRRAARAFAARPVRTAVAEGADAPALREDERATMLRALARLPLRQREVLVLRYYEELKVTEIAALLGINAGAVSTSISRALHSLGEQNGRR